MIFDVRLNNGVATFTCTLEDYDEGPTFTKHFSIRYEPSKVEGADNIAVLDSGPWTTESREQWGSKVPPWALRLAKVLEPRIKVMLLTDMPRDLRRWIDDELIETIANGLEVEDEQAV